MFGGYDPRWDDDPRDRDDRDRDRDREHEWHEPGHRASPDPVKRG